MCRLLLAVVLCGSVVAAPVPDEKPKPPTGAPPGFMTISAASLGEKGVLQLTSTELVPVTKQVPVTVTRGNQVITEIRNVTEYATTLKTTLYAPQGFEIVTGEGKTLTFEAAVPLLKATAVVLVTEGPLDPAYQKLLARDALVLVRKKTDK
jgi:hypothetical protein